MSNKLDLSGMLDFSEMDLTAPDQVAMEILAQLPEITHDIVCGNIEKYDGPVTSYKKVTTSLAEALGTITTETHVDIQKSLGKLGEREHKFECYLYTSAYTKYKYRMFFMKYGIAHYPVQFILEESIARSIQGVNANYIITCNKREEVEELMIKILSSKKVLGVMQELVRISQAKKGEIIEEEDASGNE
nr:hypothetical protein [Clostridia bacterium]